MCMSLDVHFNLTTIQEIKIWHGDDAMGTL